MCQATRPCWRRMAPFHSVQAGRLVQVFPLQLEQFPPESGILDLTVCWVEVFWRRSPHCQEIQEPAAPTFSTLSLSRNAPVLRNTTAMSVTSKSNSQGKIRLKLLASPRRRVFCRVGQGPQALYCTGSSHPNPAIIRVQPVQSRGKCSIKLGITLTPPCSLKPAGHAGAPVMSSDSDPPASS